MGKGSKRLSPIDVVLGYVGTLWGDNIVICGGPIERVGAGVVAYFYLARTEHPELYAPAKNRPRLCIKAKKSEIGLLCLTCNCDGLGPLKSGEYYRQRQQSTTARRPVLHG